MASEISPALPLAHSPAGLVVMLVVPPLHLQFLAAGHDPLTLEAFLAMERNLADVTDAQVGH
jgi:hypothetical protein